MAKSKGRHDYQRTQTRQKSRSGKTGGVGPRDQRGADYIPEHQAESFERELGELAVYLRDEYGFKGRYLFEEFQSKRLDPKVVPPAVRAAAAIEKWLSTERRNRLTNERLMHGLTGFRESDPEGWQGHDFGWVKADRLAHEARKLISKVLGPLNYPSCLCWGGHTNGASTRVSRAADAAIQKYAGQAHVTANALQHWLSYVEDTSLVSASLASQELEQVPGSVMFTVPKKTEIDRVACKEPEINMFLQRSIGMHIRKRLRKHGINLNDQTVNQDLARDALSMGLATLDLSSASDSISKMLVFQLLPFDWWSLLDDLRSHTVSIDDGQGGTYSHEMEMFSSMGNGFTFELESLIFWALVHAIKYCSGVKGVVSVFGDDIIAPSVIAPRIMRVFAWFGFTVNAKKSHWTGMFRESCGKHYYRGMDVTPFYVREPVSRKSHVIRLLNRLLIWEATGFGFIVDPVVLDFHMRWSKIIPQELWGGTDPEDPSCLVTGHAPRKQLVKELKTLRLSNKVREIADRYERIRELDQKRGISRDPFTRERLPVGLRDELVEEQDKLCLLHWFVTTSGLEEGHRSPFEVDPLSDLSMEIVQRSEWCERTAWDPWFLKDRG